MATNIRYNKFSLIFKTAKGEHIKYEFVHHTNGHLLWNEVYRKTNGAHFVVFVYARESREYLGFLSSKRGHNQQDLKYLLESLAPNI